MTPYIATLLILAPVAAQQSPVEVVVDALADHPVVAIGENHGHEEFHDWLVHLLEDPRIIGAVDDIAIEWGNALYQELMDRYVEGAEVPWDSVTMAWRNTIVSPNTVWDAPPYEAFFRAVRRINAGLDPDARYRVLLADSPVDWSTVASRDDLVPFYDRASSMADVVRRESLLQGRRSLFLAGGLHVARIPRVRLNRLGIPASEISPVAWLEIRHPGVVYSIQSLARAEQTSALGIPPPSDGPAISMSRGPLLATVPANAIVTLTNRDGSVSEVYGDAHLAEVVDAVIHWPKNQRTFTDPDPATYQVEWYWTELNRRSRIVRGQPMDSSLRG